MTTLTVLPDSTPTPVVTGAEPHIAVVAVWTLTTVAMLIMTEVSFWPAFGLGAYCAFWLGGGFGTIFDSAAVFGRDH